MPTLQCVHALRNEGMWRGLVLQHVLVSSAVLRSRTHGATAHSHSSSCSTTHRHSDVVHTGDSVQAPQETTWRTFGEGLVKMRGRSDPNSVYDFTNLARRLNITRAHIVHHSSADLAAVRTHGSLTYPPRLQC